MDAYKVVLKVQQNSRVQKERERAVEFRSNCRKMALSYRENGPLRLRTMDS